MSTGVFLIRLFLVLGGKTTGEDRFRQLNSVPIIWENKSSFYNIHKTPQLPPRGSSLFNLKGVTCLSFNLSSCYKKGPELSHHDCIMALRVLVLYHMQLMPFLFSFSAGFCHCCQLIMTCLGFATAGFEGKNWLYAAKDCRKDTISKHTPHK